MADEDFNFELHFREGFSGEEVEIWKDNEALAKLALTTRMQIGLAEIQTLSLHPGDRLTIRLVDEAIETPIHIRRGYPVVCIDRIDDALQVTPLEKSPGYV